MVLFIKYNICVIMSYINRVLVTICARARPLSDKANATLQAADSFTGYTTVTQP